jgi:hypothetical protein
VYSLGVVLLEVGFWEPLGRVARDLTRGPIGLGKRAVRDCSANRRKGWRQIQESLVAWCLDLKGDHIVKDNEFVHEVLDPLDDMVNSMSDNYSFNA